MRSKSRLNRLEKQQAATVPAGFLFVYQDPGDPDIFHAGDDTYTSADLVAIEVANRVQLVKIVYEAQGVA